MEPPADAVERRESDREGLPQSSFANGFERCRRTEKSCLVLVVAFLIQLRAFPLDVVLIFVTFAFQKET